jgi:hypothetical protein
MHRPILAAWAVLAVLCWASANVQSLDEESLPGPDHLVPVNPYPDKLSGKYHNLCHDLLNMSGVDAHDPHDPFPPRQPATIAMLSRPPFTPEECIVLSEKKAGDRHAFVLIHTRASRNIWYSMPENSYIDEDEDEGEGEPKKPPKEAPKQDPVVVSRTTKPLDPVRAERIFRLWSRMLKDVHYSTVGSGGIDDADLYEFRYHGMYGEARTPLKGPVRRLVDTGEAMIAVCESPADDLEKSLARLDAACDALEKQLAAREASKKAGATAP